jgi:glycosyltransferase involved in cell wall biosynthesis
MERAVPRILYSFPHPLGGPGINNTAWQQVNALAELGVQITVYCSSLRVPVPASVHVVQTLVVRGRRVPHRTIGLQNAYSYHDLRVARAISANGTNFDVVHTWPRACLRTIAAARRRNVTSLRELPNAHTAQTFQDAAIAGTEIGVQLPRGASHRFNQGRLKREEAEFRASDFLLAPSEYVANSFIDRGFDARKLLRHQYGFDPSAFPEPAPRTSSDKFTAVFVGRGEPAKGLHVALKAWIESGVATRGRLLVLGNIIDDYRSALDPLLSHPSIELRGFVSDVGATMRQADVLVFPTFTEGSALVTYEAMASGVIPLVSTAAGGPVTDGKDALLHQPGDVSAIAAQLRELEQNPSLRAIMRAAVLARRPDLTWLAGTQMLLNAYLDAMSR